MSININKQTLSGMYLAPTTPTDLINKTSQIVGIVEKNLPTAIPNEKYDLPTPKTSSKSSENTQSLDQNQTLCLINILREVYIIPGKNDAPELRLYLLKFLKELYQHLPHIHISLIGSTVGNIIDPQSGGYNDIDFLIQVDLKIKTNKSHTKELLNSLIKDEIDANSRRILNIIEYCLASQSGTPINHKNFDSTNPNDRKLLQESLKGVGESYLSTQLLVNSDINWSQLSASGNRCSILSFGKIEFKTTFNVCIEEGEHITPIPGLQNPSAFDRDDIKIPLSSGFLNSISGNSSLSVQACSSNVPIEKSQRELKAKELDTSQCDASKCLKGIDNITCKGCFYSNTKVNHSIYTQFLEMPDAVSKVKTHYQKQEKNPLRAICALLNFFMNGANLEVKPALIQPFHECIYPLLTYFKTDQKIPEELLLKWCHLMLVLSSTPTSHTNQLLSVNLDQQTCYLLKPNNPLDLLLDVVNLLKQHPSLSLKDLPVLTGEFKTLEQLLLKIKPSLKGEQLITFNHFLLLNCPVLLQETGTLNFEMLTLLLNSLGNIACPEKRRALIEKTEYFFETKGLKIPEFFEHLHTLTIQGSPTTSSLVLLCIQHLATCGSTQAHAFWKYAQKQLIFADFTKDEVAAFNCMQEVKLEKDLNKDELNNILKDTINIINQIPENLDLLTPSLLLLIHKLSDINCSQREINNLWSLYKIIAKKEAFPANIRSEIKEAVLFLTIKLDKSSIPNNKQREPILFIKEVLKDSSDSESTQTVMDKLACYLYTRPNGPTIAKEFVDNPLFILALIKEMKKGSPKENNAWVTSLDGNKLLQTDNKISREYNKMLLAQWEKNPDQTQYKKTLSALSSLKSFSDTSKEEIIQTYTSFVQGCINSKQQNLFNEAERILYNEMNSISPSDTAQLLHDLIFYHPKISDAVACFKKAIDQKIFTEKNEELLIKTCLYLVCSLQFNKSKEKSSFIEFSLSSKQLVTALLKTTQAIETNPSLIFLLSISHSATSSIALENTVKLFKQLYENRKNSTNDSLDRQIRTCTEAIFKHSDSDEQCLIKKLQYEQWITLIDVLVNDTILFKEDADKLNKKSIVGSTLFNLSLGVFKTIQAPCKTQRRNSLLDALKKYDNLKIESVDYYIFKRNLINSLICLNRMEEAQMYLKEIKGPNASIIAITGAIQTLFDIQPMTPLLYTGETSKIIMEKLDEYSKSNSADTGNTLPLYSCAITMLIEKPHRVTLSKDLFQKLNTHLLILIERLQKDPNMKQGTQLCECYIALLTKIGCHPSFYTLAQPMLIYAVQEKLITDRSTIERIQSGIKATAQKNQHTDK